MKILIALLSAAFLIHSTLAFACDSHNISTEKEQSHCHGNKKPESKSTDCPICEINLCFQLQQYAPLIENIKEASKFELSLSSSNLPNYGNHQFIEKLSIELKPPNPLLPQNKNWQAYYSVFRN